MTNPEAGPFVNQANITAAARKISRKAASLTPLSELGEAAIRQLHDKEGAADHLDLLGQKSSTNSRPAILGNDHNPLLIKTSR